MIAVRSPVPRSAPKPPAGRNCQQGVSLISAIFLLMLLAVIAAGMVSMVSTAHLNQAADIGGARAYQAARAAAEWGVFQLDPNAASSSLPSCFGAATLPVPGHAVTVVCTSNDYSEAGRNLRIYRIVARALSNDARPPRIERQVELTVEKCRDPALVAAPFDCR